MQSRAGQQGRASRVIASPQTGTMGGGGGGRGRGAGIPDGTASTGCNALFNGEQQKETAH